MKNRDLGRPIEYEVIYKDKIIPVQEKPKKYRQEPRYQEPKKTYKGGFITMTIVAFLMLLLGFGAAGYLIVVKPEFLFPPTAPVPAIEEYSVMYRNNTGDAIKTLETYQVEKGSTSIPEYRGSEPYRPADAAYTYTFDGWEQSGALPVSTNIEMLAKYDRKARDPETNYWTVFWMGYNDKGESDEIYQQDIEDGKTVEWTRGKPTRPDTSDYEYTFTGWYPSIDRPVKQNMTFRAQFSAKEKVKPDPNPIKYEVIWKDEIDDKRLWDKQYVEAGAIPEYKGETPKAISSPGRKYEFDRWNETPSAIHANKTYIAKYKITEDKNTYAFDAKNKAYVLTGSTATSVGGIVPLFNDGTNGPERVTTIGDGNRITIPKDTTTIEIPPYIEQIAAYAFNNRGDVFNFQVIFLDKENSKLKEIGLYAFEGYPQESIDLPDSIETIKNMAFLDSKLTSFRCPDNLNSISYYMVFNRTLNSFTIGPNVKTIDWNAIQIKGTVNGEFPDLFIPRTVEKFSERSFYIGYAPRTGEALTVRCEPVYKPGTWFTKTNSEHRWDYLDGNDYKSNGWEIKYLWNQAE